MNKPLLVPQVALALGPADVSHIVGDVAVDIWASYTAAHGYDIAAIAIHGTRTDIHSLLSDEQHISLITWMDDNLPNAAARQQSTRDDARAASHQLRKETSTSHTTHTPH